LKVTQLREIVEDIKLMFKIKYHWTWLLNKGDLLELLEDPLNPRFASNK